MADAIIRIHPMDSDAAAKERQEAICRRLDELGVENVRAMLGHGLPTNWNPIIAAWLKGARADARSG
jgi:hypothetical protein